LVLTDEEYSHSASSWFMRLVSSINHEDYYICNSEYTKKDFLKYVPVIDKNKIFVSMLACSKSFCPQTLEKIKQSREKYNIPENYIFYIGNIEPRKNLLKVVKTFIAFLEKYNINDLFLVIAGTNWSTYLDKLKNLVQSSGKYKDKIIFTGYIDDEDTAPLYSGALCSIYASIYEGFGLPILEAMSCGCPVITSNCTSLPEVAGDSAILIDCNNEEEYIEAYKTYYFDKDTRESYKKKGFERAKNFSWEKCTNKIVEIIENTVN
jgi:glycosyltransferase involved in cell wall biosynthesis